MTDRAAKILLGLIAAGLWANFATSFLQPATARSDDLSSIASTVDDIESTVNDIESTVDDIALGTCVNLKIC